MARAPNSVSDQKAVPYPRHPFSELWGTYLGTDKYRELVQSIRGSGLHHPIVLLANTVLDGYHRLCACLEAGVEPLFESYTGDTTPTGLFAYLTGTHIVKRNLGQSQLALIAAKLLRDGSGNHFDARGICRMFSIGETSLTESNRLLRNGSNGLIKLVERGALPVKVAAKAAVTLNRSAQESLAAAGPAAVKKAVSNRRKLSTPAAHRAPKVHGQDATRQLSQTNSTLNEVLNALALVRERVPMLLSTPEGNRFKRYCGQLGLPWLKDEELGFSACHPLWLLLAACTQERELTLDELKRLMRP